MRHAKAEDKSATGMDFDRTLTEKGISNAEKMGKRLAQREVLPNLIITSPARRALQTAQIIGKIIKYSGKIIQNETIYNSTVPALIDIIRNTGEGIQSLMLVGHNPSLTDLVNYFCPSASDSHRIKNLPKAGIAGIEISEDGWKNIMHRCGQLLFFDYPKKK
ncbi:MAG: phosphohistidine phosphatase SixA [Bacteroidetes bacterium]|nr:phosphohistidine phosphatase SixA [Bacteroidota bacterium]